MSQGSVRAGGVAITGAFILGLLGSGQGCGAPDDVLLGPQGHGGSGGGGGGGEEASSTGSGAGAGGAGAGGQGAGGGGGAGAGGTCVTADDCDDHDVCTADACLDGRCGSNPIELDDANVCTMDGCDPALGESHVPLNPDDGDACTEDRCDPAAGIGHRPVNTNDNNVCTIDGCNPVTGVSHVLVPIDDGNVCTADTCDPALGISHRLVSPDDGNACTLDACTASTGMTHTLIACDDGDACTFDTCNPAVGCMATPSVYFRETFANNSRGWLLGPEWQIGATAASSGHAFGNADPAFDHTPTIDNGVAGVLLGGNASTVVHPSYYLTSPVIDLGSVSTPVYLDFWRWLNSSYTPYMQNSIEVWTGSAWAPIWQSDTIGIQDTSWTRITHDVTAYKSATFQVRFGFTTGDARVYSVSSWNIDDVRLVPSPSCP